MTSKEAIKRIKDFGLYHAISDLPNSALTVEAFEKAIELLRLEDSDKLPKLYIGDDIYFRVSGMNQFGEYVDFIQTQKITRIDIDLNDILYCTASVKFIYDEVGSKVFLSREEAKLLMKIGNKI